MTGKKKSRKRKTKAQLAEERSQELRQWIAIVVLVALIMIAMLKTGALGILLYNSLRYLIGDLFWAILLIGIVWFFIAIASRKKDADDQRNPVPIILIILDVLLICAYIHAGENLVGFDCIDPYFENVSQYFVNEVDVNLGGGVTGAAMYALFSALFGRQGTMIIIIAVLIIATVLMGFMDVYKNAFSYVVEFFRTPEDEEEEPEEEEEKEKPNLWKMIQDHKEKRANFISADQEAVEEKQISEIQEKLDQGEEVVLRMKPKQIHKEKLAGIGIRADEEDEDTQGLTLLKESDQMENTLKMQTALNAQERIFISVDDLNDTYKTKEPVVQEEPVYVKETEPVSEPVFPEDPIEDTPVQKTEEPDKKKKSTVNYSNYRRPNPLRVLDPVPPKNTKGENEAGIRRKSEALVQALDTFDIHAEIKDVHIGPSVTQFEVKPDANVKVSKILSLTDNIKMQLEARDIRIEAPIPGKNAVGIEIPNDKSTPVKMKELISGLSEKDKEAPLLFFLGKDLLGQIISCRIDKMPHLLIAGQTGSGKSVCMNSIICSLLLRTRPDQVKMLLIDPKKVEFTPYHNIPHLIGPVINDASQASNALKVIVRIMDERYNIFAANGVRNITGYHEFLAKKSEQDRKHMDPMPYIVVIIDELADLMLVAGKEVEASIQRITQLARAAGIHLIVATQRPSADVITGVIKANIPSKIAFNVASQIDSRVILDHIGAERLLGNGDMLYLPSGQNAPTRIQGVYVTDEEVQKICDALSPWAPTYDDSFIMLEGVNDGSGAVTTVSEDPLFQEVKDFVIDVQKASTSLLQRQFGIGYNRAARMIDELERTGVIGPAQGSKPRDVYMKKSEDAD